MAAAERVLQAKLGWFAQPIFGNGDYPEVMKRQLAAKYKEAGMDENAVPAFTEEEKKLNKGGSII